MTRVDISKNIPSNPVVEQVSSPYLFLTEQQKEQFMTPDMREWLSNATIVHLAPPWLPIPHELRKYGGIENVMEAHIAGLAELGVKHQIVIGHPGNAKLKEKYGDKITIITPEGEGIDYNQDLLKLLQNNREKAMELERQYVHEAFRWVAKNKDKVTVVHAHTYWDMIYGVPFNPGVPVFRTEHNPLIDLPEYLERMYKHCEKKASRGSRRQTMNVSISDYQQTERPTLPWVGRVHNSVDLSRLGYRDKNTNPIPEQEKYLLYLGRVTRDKGVHNAIEIANKLGLKLIIAGSVEENEEAQLYYEQEIKPHLHKGGKIEHFAKGVGPVQKAKLLRDASCLLMPGEWNEPFGMVAIEALASGTPVVALRRGALPEIIDQDAKTGFLVDTIDEARDAVRKVVHNGEFSSANCRRRVEEFFSSAAASAACVRLYRQVPPAPYVGKERVISNITEVLMKLDE